MQYVEINPAFIEEVKKGKLDLETLLTSETTPSCLVDPITQVLFSQPIFYVPSGKSVSKHIADAKPGIDIFSNSKLPPGVNCVPNVHLRQEVDEFMDKELIQLVNVIARSMLDLKRFLLILLLSKKRGADLTCAANACRNFSKKFQQDILLLLPFIRDLNEYEKEVVLDSLIWDESLQGAVKNQIMSPDANVVFSICSMFPTPVECYKKLSIRVALAGEKGAQEQGEAVQLVNTLSQHFNTHVFFFFAILEESNLVWQALHTARVLETEHFLYFATGITTIEAVKKKVPDLPPQQLVMIAELEFNAEGMKTQLENERITSQQRLQIKQLQQQIRQLERDYQSLNEFYATCYKL